MQSMTGFGRGTHATSEWMATVEISSINRKQLEVIPNLPRSLQALESRVRKATLPHAARGRVQVAIRIERPEDAEVSKVRANLKLAQSLESAFLELSTAVGRGITPTSTDFLRLPGIFEVGDSQDLDPDTVWEVIEPAFNEAIHHWNMMRSTEGNHLLEDFLDRLKGLENLTQAITRHAPSRPERQRELLNKRLSDLGIALEDSDERLAKELAIFADRCDVSEELIRLDSHFSKFSEYLHSKEASGRSLDFLCQELLREFNTIGSKANDALIAQTIVEAKTELEKIREQVQNIE
ncbi:MAG: YicC/YloC family endoribonuclease [Akkermansiaceae bacterium]